MCLTTSNGGVHADYMPGTDDHLAELLRMPVEERARAARALLDSLDEEHDDEDAAQAQVTELIRR